MQERVWGKRRVLALVVLVSTLLSMAGPSAAGPPGTGVSIMKLKARPMLIQRGSTVGIAGSLRFADRSSPAGDHVVLSMTPPGRPSVDLADRALSASGTFTLKSPKLARIGVYLFAANFVGDAVEAPASSTQDVTVTALQLTVSSAVVPYLHTVRITAHLGTYALIASRRVAIFAAPYPRTTASLVKAGPVDAHGDLAFVATVRRGVRFVAAWIVHGPDIPSNTVAVRVKPGVVATPGGFRTLSGGISIYKGVFCSQVNYWATCPPYQATIKPPEPGGSVCALEQRLVSGTWRTFHRECRKLRPGGLATLHLRLQGAAGELHRARAYVRGDADQAASSSGWSYYEWQFLTARGPDARSDLRT